LQREKILKTDKAELYLKHLWKTTGAAHIHLYTASKLSRDIEKAGLKTIAMKRAYFGFPRIQKIFGMFPFLLKPWMYIDRWLLSKLPIYQIPFIRLQFGHQAVTVLCKKEK
jgi:hypothetical protein